MFSQNSNGNSMVSSFKASQTTGIQTHHASADQTSSAETVEDWQSAMTPKKPDNNALQA